MQDKYLTYIVQGKL